MNKAELIDRRRSRAMAQVLELFEEKIERRIPQDVAKQFKGSLRRKINSLTIDVTEIMELKPGEAINGHAQALKDQLDIDATVEPVGRRR